MWGAFFILPGMRKEGPIEGDFIMKLNKVCAVCYSATGNTKYIVDEIAACIGETLGVPFEVHDFTRPKDRKSVRSFRERELVVFGTPVYAGRVPNKILPAVQTFFKGNGALAVPVVTFGNRSYDNALIELRNELENQGFHTIAGGAFVAEHAFCGRLAPGRPDKEDRMQIHRFGVQVADKIMGMTKIPERIPVRGTEPIPAYYRPLGIDGKPAVFLKAKPKTREACTDCKLCAKVCPMGSIDYDHPGNVTGICIKCQACVKACPAEAKYFDDEAFLSHVAMLEHNYIRRAENEIFV